MKKPWVCNLYQYLAVLMYKSLFIGFIRIRMFINNSFVTIPPVTCRIFHIDSALEIPDSSPVAL